MNKRHGMPLKTLIVWQKFEQKQNASFTFSGLLWKREDQMKITIMSFHIFKN